MIIEGTVIWKNLEGGFWGIEDQKGQKWLPVNMPNQLKHEGKQVKVEATEAEVFGTAMWGQAVRIISFSTLAP